MLETISPCQFKLTGVINFETSPAVEQQGKKQLQGAAGEHWQIDLSKIVQVDSSALSVCLSWMRLARAQQKIIKFTHMPLELSALAEVCGVKNLLLQ